MTLVNDTDANRDNIDEYLKELQSMSDESLSLLSTLREVSINCLSSFPSINASLSSILISFVAVAIR